MAFLEVENLEVAFDVRDRLGRSSRLRAVDGVSLAVAKGEAVGLVGESGCGKTTLGNALTGLIPIVSGRITYEGMNVAALKGSGLKEYRRRVQMVFQDPFGSLNPRMTVGTAIGEVLKVHGLSGAGAARAARIAELLAAVGLEPGYSARYPHEFSGGQRQRIGIARALAVSPSLIIADEPVSALDVSVQVQILNLMKSLQEKLGLSYIFIAHDLAVVRYMCRRVYVMYLGKIVEQGSELDMFENPCHPYTEALLSAVPDVDRGLRKQEGASARIVLKGDVPSPIDRIPGCPFHPRCHRARAVCRVETPVFNCVGEGHCSACHFAEEMAGRRRIAEPFSGRAR